MLKAALKYVVKPYAIFALMAKAYSFLAIWYFEAPISSVAFLFLCGAFLWTLIEYVIHRYLLHDFYTASMPKKSHLEHHDMPDTTDFFAAPPTASIPALVILSSVLFYFDWQITHNLIFSLGLLSGIIWGYVFYEGTHYVVHTVDLIKKNESSLASRFVWALPPYMYYLKWCKKHHYVHHNTDDKYNFGVTTSLWDYIFKTHAKYRLRGDAANKNDSR